MAVSLVVWRSSPEQVQVGLAALAAGSLRPDLVHVLSNEDVDPPGSGWDTLSSAGLDVVVQRSPANLGFAGGHNAVLTSLFADPGREAVLVLNPDVAVHADCVAELLRFAGRRATATLVGPLLELAHGDELTGEGAIDTAGIVWTRTGRHLDHLQGRPLADAPSTPVRTAGISGACLLVTRNVYERVVQETGEFFDGDFLAYREDAELGLRATAVGVESWVVPSAKARHARGLRGTSRATSAHVNRLGVRNRFLIRFKYGHRRPGGWFGAPLRDLAVVGAVLVRERESIPGLVEAWRLRAAMRSKGRRLRAAGGAR